MTLKTDIHVGDKGTIFRATIADQDIPVDISGATTKLIIFLKPDGTKVELAGSFTTDGSDGLLQYTTLAATLDIEGVWNIGARITTSSGEWTATLVSFKVEEKY